MTDAAVLESAAVAGRSIPPDAAVAAELDGVAGSRVAVTNAVADALQDPVMLQPNCHEVLEQVRQEEKENSRPVVLFPAAVVLIVSVVAAEGECLQNWSYLLFL